MAVSLEKKVGFFFLVGIIILGVLLFSDRMTVINSLIVGRFGTGLASLSFLCTVLATVFIFMPFSDRSFRTRKWLWGIGSIVQITAWGMLMFVPYTIPTVFAMRP